MHASSSHMDCWPADVLAGLWLGSHVVCLAVCESVGYNMHAYFIIPHGWLACRSSCWSMGLGPWCCSATCVCAPRMVKDTEREGLFDSRGY